MTASYAADLQLFIDGAWRAGEGRDERPVFNPASADTIGALPILMRRLPQPSVAGRRGGRAPPMSAGH